jgi:membrane protein DedA with SNARE-associated domain
MDLQALLAQYGYVVIFLGTVVEGETILVLGGYFAHRGYLDLVAVIATAFAGAVCGDQFFFYIGRHHAKGLLARFPKLRDKVNVALVRIEAHQVKVVLSMRFLWGLRIALPIALGLSSMNAKRFLWLNLVSAALWSCVFSVVGFGASRVISRIVEDLYEHEKLIAAVLLLAAVLALIWHFGRPKRASK